MILLSFTVRNHKSIRDEVTIDLTRPSLKTLQPKDGDWALVSYPVAGVFGGNATGKSAILDAFAYAFAAIRESATTWQAERRMPRAPFLLDANTRFATSFYQLDFIHEGRRHQYGFEVDQDGICSEWLRDLPRSRWRTLMIRDRENKVLKFHESFRARVDVTPRELVLSRALQFKGYPFQQIAADMVASFDIVLVRESHRSARLAGIADSLADGDITFRDLEALLAVADIGVEKVAVEERNIPEPIRRALSRLHRDLSNPGDDDPTHQRSEDDNLQVKFELGDLEQVVRHLLFKHRGVGDDPPAFSIEDESDGTVAWLATAVPALEALRRGGLLIVDEIDSSLHPHLLEALLNAFADPNVNKHHAQLIFSSHEAYILSPLSDIELEPEQVWVTDKTREGVTELTSLSEFPRHRDANIAKRYLTGRYGGVPLLMPSLFATLVDARRP